MLLKMTADDGAVFLVCMGHPADHPPGAVWLAAPIRHSSSNVSENNS